MTIICASDLHIGYVDKKRSDTDRRYRKINDFFELVKTKEPERLILCGDILDLWRYPSKDKINNEVLQNILKIDEDYHLVHGAIENLKGLFDEVETTYIWGNHDYEVKKRIDLGSKVTIRDEFRDKDLNIFFCHGWRFDMWQRRFAWAYGWLVTWFPYLYRAYIKNTPWQIKKNKTDYLHLKDKTHEKAKKKIRWRKYDYLIMGHTHTKVDDPKLFNCGDMITNFSYIEIVDRKPYWRTL